MLDHIWRCLREHAERFKDLPEVTVPSAAVTDEDTSRWSEERYARDLKDLDGGAL